jgi:hypothetical protein
MDPCAHGKILYEGTHHDWGDYYLNKTKRFLIVELELPVDAPKGFCWVSLETASALLLENHLVTSDLRVAIPLLTARGVQHSVSTESGPSHAENWQLVRNLGFSPDVVDSRGIGVSFFKTETKTREVNSWVQPLLVLQKNLEICLIYAKSSSGRVYAVEQRTQPGLLGQQLWFPANKGKGKIVRTVKTSAEGGRFWRYQIEIKLLEIENPSDATVNDGGSTHWLSEHDLSLLVTQSLQTSLELRMAWSLSYAGGIDTP